MKESHELQMASNKTQPTTENKTEVLGIPIESPAKRKRAIENKLKEIAIIQRDMDVYGIPKEALIDEQKAIMDTPVATLQEELQALKAKENKKNTGSVFKKFKSFFW